MHSSFAPRNLHHCQRSKMAFFSFEQKAISRKISAGKRAKWYFPGTSRERNYGGKKGKVKEGVVKGRRNGNVIPMGIWQDEKVSWCIHCCIFSNHRIEWIFFTSIRKISFVFIQIEETSISILMKPSSRKGRRSQSLDIRPRSITFWLGACPTYNSTVPAYMMPVGATGAIFFFPCCGYVGGGDS